MTNENQRPSPTGHPDAVITISVKEVLDRMEAKLDKAIETKADRADIARLDTHLTGVDARLDRVEDWQHRKDTATGTHTERDQRTWKLSGRLGMLLYGLAILAIMTIALLH